jgi:hypothetical protein
VLDEVILGKKRFVHFRLALAWPRRWVMWAAVAVFGHWAYRKEQSKGTAPPLEHEMLEDVVRQVRAQQGQSA